MLVGMDALCFSEFCLDWSKVDALCEITVCFWLHEFAAVAGPLSASNGFRYGSALAPRVAAADPSITPIAISRCLLL